MTNYATLLVPDLPFREPNDHVFQRLLLTALCFCAATTAALIWQQTRTPPEIVLPELGMIQSVQSTFDYTEPIVLEFANEDPGPRDWVGLFFPNDYTNRSTYWQYICPQPCGREKHYGGEVVFDAFSTLYSGYNLTWPVCSREYVACLMIGATNTTLACSGLITVTGQGECVGFNGGM